MLLKMGLDNSDFVGTEFGGQIVLLR
jgi:hypothetical protein